MTLTHTEKGKHAVAADTCLRCTLRVHGASAAQAPVQPGHHIPQSLGVDTTGCRLLPAQTTPSLHARYLAAGWGSPVPHSAGASHCCSEWARVWLGHTGKFSAAQKLDLHLPHDV